MIFFFSVNRLLISIYVIHIGIQLSYLFITIKKDRELLHVCSHWTRIKKMNRR